MKLENETIKLSSNLRNRKRQLEEEEYSLIKMEAKLAKKQWNFFNAETRFQSLTTYTNLTTIKKLRNLVEKLTKYFRNFEKDLGMQSS